MEAFKAFTKKFLTSPREPIVAPSREDNPLTELLFLSGHSNIVRLLTPLEGRRLASADDDGYIKVWNCDTGALVCTLYDQEGKGLPTTCMLALDRVALASGSADKEIRIWNTEQGALMWPLPKQEHPRHQGSVKCLTRISATSQSGAYIEGSPIQFCSGGNDRNLFVWSWDPTTCHIALLRTITRKEDENLNCMLVLGSNTIVTGSNSACLMTYRIDIGEHERTISYHRESVQCLVELPKRSAFVSGSLDGVIVVWDETVFTRVLELNYPSDSECRDKHGAFPFCVRSLLPIGDRYLIAAIAKGFDIYDLTSKQRITHFDNAHNSPLTCIISLYSNTRFLTVSTDSIVKLWEAPTDGESSINLRTSSQQPRKKGSLMPRPLGEMQAHTGTIFSMVPLSDSSFATCADDNTVVVWKDEVAQSEERSIISARALLRRHQAPSSEAPVDFDAKIQQQLEEINRLQKRQDISDVFVDSVLFAKALALKKKCTPEVVAVELLKEGIALNLVAAVLMKIGAPLNL